MNPRDPVHQHIARQVRRFPNFDHRPLDTTVLSARDAALARAIEHAVTRHWLTLQAIIETRLNQPWERLHPPVRAALLAGAAQLLYLDRVPDHAAINEAVNWVKSGKHPRARGVVNAVLRRVADLRTAQITDGDVFNALGHDRAIAPRPDGSAWRLADNVFAEDALLMLSQQTSVSMELLRHWSKRHNTDAVRRLAAHCLVQPPVIVTGIDAQSAQQRDDFSPHEATGYYVFEGEGGALNELLASSPQARVQDPTAASAVGIAHAVDAPPRVVLDLCAGKGTKTHQLAQQWPDARIIATDRDRERHAVLRETFTEHPTVEVVDFKNVDSFREQIDLVLLDVPCSNTGVLARRVEAKYRFSAASLESVVGVQRQLMADAIPLLAPHGHILYSTCSIEPEENEQQAAWLEKWHDFERVDERFRLPVGLPGEPGRAYRDGGYAVLLRSPR